MYLVADWFHFRIRLEEDGYRESTESWLAVLRELKRRELGAPRLAIGVGVLGS